MKPIVAALFVLTACALLSGAATTASAAEPSKLDGKQIFLAQKCNLCHMVSSAGIEATTKSEKLKGPDLTGAAAKREARLLTDYLRKKADINGKKHSKGFTGSDEELGALIAWLQAQVKK